MGPWAASMAELADAHEAAPSRRPDLALECTYLVPIRWRSPGAIHELAEYLRQLTALVAEVIVVDDSGEELFAEHGAALGPPIRHVRPHPDLLSAPNGKVDGVMTGLREAACDAVVIADDDVRWDGPELRRAVMCLADVELVRPQNYFDPLTWHARWDTARSLLNRVVSGDLDFPVGDFPGTLLVRRGFLLRIGGYDGKALFENLELMRTVKAAGGRVASPLDLYVAREPPSTRHFLRQRLRQAYEDQAMPLRLTASLAILPLAALAARRPRRLAGAALAAAAAAEAGRRRAGGGRHLSPAGSLLAPLWLAERGLFAWVAVWRRALGRGVGYGRGRLLVAATPMAELRARLGATATGGVSGRGRAGSLGGKVG